MPSFDVVSKINLAELDNAINQARKEISTRFDFQGTKTEITLAEDRKSILIKSASEGRVEAAFEVLQARAIKRGISGRSLKPGEPDSKALGVVKLTVAIQQGIAVEKSKELVKLLKDAKVKAQGSIQGDELRISGKNRDDLQAAIALFKQQQEKLDIDMQFVNFRE